MIPPSDDIDRLMTVMSAAFAPEYREAWTRRQVEDALVIGNCHYFVVNETGTPLSPGEDAAGFYLSRTGFGDEELLLFAVSPQFRRRGIGAKLITHLKQSAWERGADRLFLEMREGNSAESLYRANGFFPIGRRPNYYQTLSGTRIDAVTFACQTGPEDDL